MPMRCLVVALGILCPPAEPSATRQPAGTYPLCGVPFLPGRGPAQRLFRLFIDPGVAAAVPIKHQLFGGKVERDLMFAIFRRV